MEERGNVLFVLNKTLEALKMNDASKLKELSDQTIHSASKGDVDNLNVAIIIYSLEKIFSRHNYRELDGWDSFRQRVIDSLKDSIDDLQKNDDEKFRKDFSFIRKPINKVSGKLKRYIEDVFKKGEIVKASRIYEHGISAESIAKKLGISMYDLQTYVGQTGISDVKLNYTIDVNMRIGFLEEMFK